MSLSSGLRLLVVSGLSSGLVLACVVENDHHPYGGSGGAMPTPTATGTGAGGNCQSAPSTNPVLADVDTGRVMNAQPGDGVGIFTEYGAGGHWHVWWTCDTNKTGATCPTNVSITPESGVISNVTGDSAADTGAISATPQKVDVTTTTTTTVDGVRFDTTPGAVIALSASVGGCYDGSFLFFVQNGKVNGGFTGVLTDPVRLEGSTP